VEREIDGGKEAEGEEDELVVVELAAIMSSAFGNAFAILQNGQLSGG
jgi:hypothetical protein